MGGGIMKLGLKMKLPPTFKTEAALKQLQLGLNQFVKKDVSKSFAATVRTWRNKPKWEYEQGRSSQLYARIYTSSKIYSYVNFGTRVRYATMSPGFQAKTVANWIGSRAGRGGVAFISRLHPRPGIKPRNFDKAIARYWQPEFEDKMKPFFIKAAQASGHGR